MPEFPDNERFRKLLGSYPGKAIQFLYEFYYRDLIRASEKLTHDRSVSEDILQETFFHVWRNHDDLARHHDQPIWHYLLCVVQRKSINVYRRARRTEDWKREYLRDRADQVVEHSEEDRLIVAEMEAHIRLLMAQFPRRERECFTWSREKEWTNKQIAALLRISEKAVERSITSANKRLRKAWLSFGVR